MAANRWLSLPRDRRRGTGWWALALLGTAILAIFGLVTVLQSNPFPFVVIDLIIFGGFYAMPCLIAAVLMWLDRARYRDYLAELQQIGRGLGLTFHERVESALLVDFAFLPLFLLTASFSRRAGYCFQGEQDGFPVTVFEYEYQGKTRRPFRCGQTVFLIRLPVSLPSFTLCPLKHEWDDLLPGWVSRAGVGKVVVELDRLAYEPTVIHSTEPEPVEKLFSTDRLRLLGSFTECSLESQEGFLLFYSHDVQIPPAGIPRALARAIEVARILSLPDDQLPRAEVEEEGLRPLPVESPPHPGIQTSERTV